MATIVPSSATLDDLYREEGKAELVNGRIVRYMASGDLPSDVAFEIAVSLRSHVQLAARGIARSDGLGYAIDPPLRSGRQSFQPDASYYDGPLPANRMRFILGPPTLAVEVRSECDYRPGAETEIAAKRADYFEAGTLAVWDVDPVAETITLFRHSDPTNGIVFRRGNVADAEPAVPGWRVAVDDIFG